MSPNEEEQKIGGGGEQGGELEEEVDDEESEEDGDIDDEEEDDDGDLIIAQAPEDDEGEGEEEEDEENINSASPSTSSSSEDNPNKQQNPTNSTTITAVISSSSILPSAAAPNGSADETAPPAGGSSPDHKRQRTSSDVPAITTAAAAASASEEKKPPALDDSRRLFQRLWTDGDEIGLLQGFLEYTKQRGSHNSSHHHDTAPFYDQIKTQLQLDFNKNQLVEKLRRLKKKYRNVLSRISSGKEFSFKSPHDQATFEISRKIWSVTGGTVGVGVEEAVLEGEEGNPNPAGINTSNENFHNNNNSIFDANKSDKKTLRSRKRSRKRAAEDKSPNCYNQPTSSIPNVIEDTVRSCLSPLFRELLSCAIGGPCNGGGYGSLALGPLPLNFGGNNSLNFSGGGVVDEKWRKQQILELEVYSKRIELVQDQINSALEKLKSMS